MNAVARLYSDALGILHKEITAVGGRSLTPAFLLKVIFLLYILFRVFSVDIFPVSPNDTVANLHSARANILVNEPLRIFQPRGYKFAGYPIFMSLCDALAGFLPVSSLTMMSLIQRLLLALSLGWLVVALGLLSAPLVLFLSSGPFLAQSNILYSEGMTLPVAMIFAIALAKLYEKKNDDRFRSSLKARALFAILATTFLLLVLTKVNFSVLSLLLMGLAFDPKFARRQLRIAPTKLVVPAVLLAILPVFYIIGISIDNSNTYNRFTPVIGQERIAYWGAWNQIFEEHPENQSRSELAEFFDDGSPYTFMHRIEKEAGGLSKFKQTGPILEKRTTALVDTANISMLAEQGRTFVRGILGGGKEELGYTRSRILSANGAQEYTAGDWHNNHHTKAYGMKDYFVKFNGGEPPELIGGFSSSPIVSRNEYRIQQALLTVLVLLVTGWFLIKRRASLLILYVLIAYAVSIATLARYFVDVWRYIIPNWAILMVVLFFGLKTSLDKRGLAPEDG